MLHLFHTTDVDHQNEEEYNNKFDISFLIYRKNEISNVKSKIIWQDILDLKQKLRENLV